MSKKVTSAPARIRSMPKKPDTMTQGNPFSLGRKSFTLAFSREKRVSEIYKNNARLKPYHLGKGIPLSSSQYVNKRKAVAIGESSIPATNVELNNYSKDKTSRNSAVSRVRGGGSVASQEKGCGIIYLFKTRIKMYNINKPTLA